LQRFIRRCWTSGWQRDKLAELVKVSKSHSLDQAQIMSDIFFLMGQIRYETARENQALDLLKQSAKIGMLGGVKRNIVRAFNAVRRIDNQQAKELLTSDLVYQDSDFVRNRLSKQVNPFMQTKTRAKLYASTLFVDIAGFSSLMKQSDEQMTVKMIDELIDRLCIVIYQNDGYIDKFLGDGFMAIFEHGDRLDAEAALCGIRASVDMNRAIRNKNRRFKEVYQLDHDITFRMGMSTGEIYAIFLGNYIKREFTYLGNAVNLASKLESVAEKQGLFIDRNTHDLIADGIHADEKEVELPSFGKTRVYHFHRLKRNDE
jgi:class 3 adenylate cyclase